MVIRREELEKESAVYYLIIHSVEKNERERASEENISFGYFHHALLF